MWVIALCIVAAVVAMFVRTVRRSIRPVEHQCSGFESYGYKAKKGHAPLSISDPVLCSACKRADDEVKDLFRSGAEDPCWNLSIVIHQGNKKSREVCPLITGLASLEECRARATEIKRYMEDAGYQIESAHAAYPTKEVNHFFPDLENSVCSVG